MRGKIGTVNMKIKSVWLHVTCQRKMFETYQAILKINDGI